MGGGAPATDQVNGGCAAVALAGWSDCAGAPNERVGGCGVKVGGGGTVGDAAGSRLIGGGRSRVGFGVGGRDALPAVDGTPSALPVLFVAVEATGSDRPRSFPRLATPTPQVSWVLYPEQVFPRSMHCVQYGRRRSQVVLSCWHAKQSTAAPVVGARRRRLRGGASFAAGSRAAGGAGTGPGSPILVVAQEREGTMSWRGSADHGRIARGSVVGAAKRTS